MKCLRLFLVTLAAFAALSAAPMVEAAKDSVEPDLASMLIKLDAAQVEFYNGRPAAAKALWSHADDVTLTGGSGGAIEKGWKNVSKRIDWASANFSRGSQTNENVSIVVHGRLAYVVGYQHVRFYAPGASAETKRTFRVTTVLRKESRGWRIVHRHADATLDKQAPR